MPWHWSSTEACADKNTNAFYFAQSDCGCTHTVQTKDLDPTTGHLENPVWMMDHTVTSDNGKYIQQGHRVTVHSHIFTIAPSRLKGNLSCAPPHVVERRPTLVSANTHSCCKPSGVLMSQTLLIIHSKECAGFRDSVSCVFRTLQRMRGLWSRLKGDCAVIAARLSNTESQKGQIGAHL